MQGKLFNVEQSNISSNDYYTPAWIFEKMALRFDLDVASPPNGIPWIPADRYFTQLDDGLAQDWHGRVWCNPPFKGITPWVEKFIEHGNGVALLPLEKGKYTDLINKHADAHVILPAYLKFETQFSKHSDIRPVCLLHAIGAENVKAIGRVGRLYK